MLNLSEISKISEINLPASPIIFFEHRQFAAKLEESVLLLKLLKKIFRLVFYNGIGLQFLLIFCPSFFSMSFITAAFVR